MGDPKKPKKKYQTPSHPFRKARIESEIVFKHHFGLKNKKEIWKMEAKLKTFTRHAKRIIAERTVQSEKEKQQILARLVSLGLIAPGAQIGDVLNLNLENILNRRLQTVLVRKNLARSFKQSRQYITHGHVLVGGRIITAPSYLVHKEEEGSLAFVPSSSLSSVEHPERAIAKPYKLKPLPKKEERHRR